MMIECNSEIGCPQTESIKVANWFKLYPAQGRISVINSFSQFQHISSSLFTVLLNELKIIQSMKSISPNIFVNDIYATITFYSKLGFTLADEVATPDGEKIFALMKNGNVTFMFQTLASIEGIHPMVSRSSGGSLLLYISVDNIRQYYDQIKDKVEGLTELEKTFYGATEFSLCDNNNYLLTFAEHD